MARTPRPSPKTPKAPKSPQARGPGKGRKASSPSPATNPAADPYKVLGVESSAPLAEIIAAHEASRDALTDDDAAAADAALAQIKAEREADPSREPKPRPALALPPEAPKAAKSAKKGGPHPRVPGPDTTYKTRVIPREGLPEGYRVAYAVPGDWTLPDPHDPTLSRYTEAFPGSLPGLTPAEDSAARLGGKPLSEEVRLARLTHFWAWLNTTSRHRPPYARKDFPGYTFGWFLDTGERFYVTQDNRVLPLPGEAAEDFQARTKVAPGTLLTHGWIARDYHEWETVQAPSPQEIEARSAALAQWQEAQAIVPAEAPDLTADQIIEAARQRLVDTDVDAVSAEVQQADSQTWEKWLRIGEALEKAMAPEGHEPVPPKLQKQVIEGDPRLSHLAQIHTVIRSNARWCFRMNVEWFARPGANSREPGLRHPLIEPHIRFGSPNHVRTYYKTALNLAAEQNEEIKEIVGQAAQPKRPVIHRGIEASERVLAIWEADNVRGVTPDAKVDLIRRVITAAFAPKADKAPDVDGIIEQWIASRKLPKTSHTRLEELMQERTKALLAEREAEFQRTLAAAKAGQTEDQDGSEDGQEADEGEGEGEANPS